MKQVYGFQLVVELSGDQREEPTQYRLKHSDLNGQYKHLHYHHDEPSDAYMLIDRLKLEIPLMIYNNMLLDARDRTRLERHAFFDSTRGVFAGELSRIHETLFYLGRRYDENTSAKPYPNLDSPMRALDGIRELWPYFLYNTLRGRINSNSFRPTEFSEIAAAYRLIMWDNALPPYLYEPARAEPRYVDDAVNIVSVTRHSPLQIVIELIGSVGSLFGLILIGLWTKYYVEHSRVDLRQKELAKEASEIILSKMREGEIEVTPGLVEAIIKNANIQSIELPAIAKIELRKW